MFNPEFHKFDAFSLVSPLVGDFHRNSVVWGGIVGMFIGLLPKDNLLTLLFVIFLFVLRTNLVVGLASTIGFSFIAMLFAPLADLIGNVLLSNYTFQAYGSYLFTLPLVAWTELNNTIVLGQFVIGSLLFVPAHFVLNTTLKKLGFTDPIRIRKIVPDPAPVEPITKVDVIYTVPVEYKTPDFFRPSTGDTGRFTTKH